MYWIWMLVMFAFLVVLEMTRYRRTSTSLNDNRLRHVNDFDGFLQCMEGYLQWGTDAYGSLFVWSDKLPPGSDKLPPGTVSTTPTTTLTATPVCAALEQQAIKKSIVKFLSQSSHDLTASQLERIEAVSWRVQQIAEAERKSGGKYSGVGVSSASVATGTAQTSTLPSPFYLNGLLDNFHHDIHYWAFTPADIIAYIYRRQVETRILAAGFQRQVRHGLTIFVRPGESETASGNGKPEPPILFLHGISSTLGWLEDAVQVFPKSRTLIYPRHPALTYSFAHFGKGQLITTLQYVRLLILYLEEQHIREVDVIAWSFGGMVRNYLNVEWSTGKFRRELMVEPLGTPTANSIGSTYNLLSFSEAYRRANQYAPYGRKWHHALVVLYLRFHVHTRVLWTEPYWNRHAMGKPHSWNHKGMKVLLSRDDIVAPPSAGVVQFLETQCPLACFQEQPGEHGSWPANHLQDFLRECNSWINHQNNN